MASVTPTLSRHDSPGPEPFAVPHDCLVVMLVGLPASGKSTLARHIHQFVSTCTPYTSAIYNAGDIRRQNSSFHTSDFFNPNNLQGRMDREMYADINLHNLLHDLRRGATQVGFLDATNTTIDRRRRMFDTIRASGINPHVVVLDVQCTKPHLLNFNISGKAHNRDYHDKDYLTAVNDFKVRTRHYHKVYQPIVRDELAHYPLAMYVRVCNAGESFDNWSLDDSFKKTHFYLMLMHFESNYYNTEGKRYFEAVEAFYKNSTAGIAG
ncbi:P-loop containing nucleoside triphosphate hydrolase protein [Suhomyces tanzawaensis NRRL Y-17324]|uniref:p-loop containing nucleoside triphosphate hydrolase protein n=1 Tax=Suhomyces tanzawaensis NRRL Y-17324 TaxID=984487 RepID=A0A1E4SP89_9ASCO|nr:P-loop containing nucleoside triphosphate hydrolase protein [Suhomyces tanzawaensis NRRL Y-17324]ODV81344.1 P-loop containing nucleoside triphosphate hydrolase protein [Suhomyces tanzawaensis NRRL Y-17324]